MNSNIIKNLAAQFRQGIECAIECGAITPRSTRTTLPQFPRGCCEIASDLLAEYLLENGIVTHCVHGEYYFDYRENKYPHTWLETNDGYIIDITADQFRSQPGFEKTLLPSCYVGHNRGVYDSFSSNKRIDPDFSGLRSYNEPYQEMLIPMYRIIKKHLR